MLVCVGVVVPDGVPPVGEAGAAEVVVGAAEVVVPVVVGVVVVPVVDVVEVVDAGASAEASRGTVRSGVDLGTE